MRRISQLSVALLLAGSFSLSAQRSIVAQYNDAYQAYVRGDNGTVIRLLEPLVRSDELQGVGLGRVWLLLGASYRATADYGAAQRAYDSAVNLFKDDPNASEDEAVALRESGALDRELGDVDSSERLEKESLRISEQNHEHGEIAKVCEALADLSFIHRKFRVGEQFISRAEDEARLVPDFDVDDRAYLAQLKGTYALKTDDMQAAIGDFQQAIDLFTGRYGEDFFLTGWAYVLLGTAYDREGAQESALDAAQKGVALLGRSVGTQDPRYAVAEICYARVLHKAGQRSLAAKLMLQAEKTLLQVRQTECAGCLVNVATLAEPR